MKETPMKRFAGTFLVGAAALALVTGSALAQYQAPGGGGGAAPGQGQMQAPGGAGAGAGMGAGGAGQAAAPGQVGDNFGQLMASLNALPTPADVGAISGTPTINVVDVSDLLKGNNAAALNNALDRNETQLAELKTAITANSTLSAALQAQQVNLDDVVAIDVAAGGEITVYTETAAP
jgi:hypothetical protein